MSYRIAAVDVHKKMLAVVVADVAGEGEYQFERRKVDATPDPLQLLAQWLCQQEVEEVVMESTAQYWKPVWVASPQSPTLRSGPFSLPGMKTESRSHKKLD